MLKCKLTYSSAASLHASKMSARKLWPIRKHKLLFFSLLHTLWPQNSINLLINCETTLFAYILTPKFFFGCFSSCHTKPKSETLVPVLVFLTTACLQMQVSSMEPDHVKTCHISKIIPVRIHFGKHLKEAKFGGSHLNEWEELHIRPKP